MRGRGLIRPPSHLPVCCRRPSYSGLLFAPIDISMTSSDIFPYVCQSTERAVMHIETLRLFEFADRSGELEEKEREHLKECEDCSSILVVFKKYVTPELRQSTSIPKS